MDRLEEYGARDGSWTAHYSSPKRCLDLLTLKGCSASDVVPIPHVHFNTAPTAVALECIAECLQPLKDARPNSTAGQI